MRNALLITHALLGHYHAELGKIQDYRYRYSTTKGAAEFLS